jgi:flavodoxin
MNNIIIFYNSISRSSLLVANKFKNFNIFSDLSLFDISNEKLFLHKSCKHIFFIVTTTGDSELHSSYENFLKNNNWANNFSKSLFYIIEIGIYNGLDKTSFGSGKIIENYLSNNNMIYSGHTLSLDSYPYINLNLLNNWFNLLSKDYDRS